MFVDLYNAEKSIHTGANRALDEVEAGRLARIAQGSSGFAPRGLFNSVKAGFSRSAGAIRLRYTGSSKPQEQCC